MNMLVAIHTLRLICSDYSSRSAVASLVLTLCVEGSGIRVEGAGPHLKVSSRLSAERAIV